MSDVRPSKAPRSLSRWARRAAVAIAGLVALAAVLRVALLTPLGAALAERALNGRAIASYGVLKVEGVSGDPLRTLRVARLTVADDDGVWLVVEDARLDWRALGLQRSRIIIEALDARRVAIARAPTPSPHPAPRGGGRAWRVSLDALSLPEVALTDAAPGAPATLAIEASAVLAGRETWTLDLDVARQDAPGDRLTVHAARQANGALVVDGALAAARDGPLAALAGLSAHALDGTVNARGAIDAGRAEFALRVDDAPFLSGAGSWRAGGAQARATADLAAAPELAPWAERLGPELAAALTLAPNREGLRAATARFDSDRITLAVNGDVDLAARAAPDGLAFVATAASVRDLLGPLAPASLDAGAVSLSGRATFENGIALDGSARIEAIGFGAWQARAASGPLRIRRADGETVVRTTMTLVDAAAPSALAARLIGDAPTVTLDARRAPDGALRLDAATLDGVSLFASVEGDIAIEGAAAFDVTADARDLAAFASVLEGAAHVTARATRDPQDTFWTVDAEARGADVASAAHPWFDTLLGPEPTLHARADVSAAGVSDLAATLTGAALEAEAQGALDLAGDWAVSVDAGARGPIALGPAAVDGALVAAARIEGPAAHPRLRLDARTSALDAGPVALSAPRLRLQIDDLSAPPRARIDIDASTAYGPLAASGVASLSDSGPALDDLALTLADVALSGSARRDADAPRVDAALTGFNGALLGRATLDGERIAIDATLTENARLASLRSAALQIEGALDDAAVSLSAESALYDFAVDAEGRFTRDADALAVQLTPRGRVNGVALAAPEPWRLAWSPATTQITLALEGDDGGRLSASATRKDGATRIEARLSDAPLSALNAVREGARLVGAADGDLVLAGRDRLTGTGTLQLTDAGAPERVSARLDGALDVAFAENAAHATLSLNDTDGFTASAVGDLPLTLDAWPPRPRLDRDAPATATGEARGDVAALWALLGLPDIAMSGHVEGEGALTGTIAAPELAGAGRMRDGTVESAPLGARFTNVAAEARFDGARLVIDRIAANDDADGMLEGSGDIVFGGEPGSETDVRLQAHSLQVLNTPDARVVASGDARLTRSTDETRISGDLTLDRGEFRPPNAASGAVRPPTLDVVEINRPDDLAPPTTRRRRATAFDVRVNAPRRLFVRASGLDSEWALDARVTGSTAAPLIDGTATLVRGDLQIAGERFRLDDAQITFAGAPKDAALAITAVREDADLTVTARITGTAEAPRIALESTPAYPQSEILSRMLFARSSSQLTALEAAQLAAAASQLAGGGGFDLLGPLRQSLGVDRLSVGGDGAGGALVTGGRYLADDLYLEVASTATGAAEAAIEWEIRPRLELVSRFGAGRDTSIAVRWRRDY